MYKLKSNVKTDYVIIVQEDNKNHYLTKLPDGTVLGKFRTPLLSSARKLLSMGYDPEATLGMTRDGVKVDMFGTIGKLAKWTVLESDTAGPMFVRYRNNLSTFKV